MSNFDPEGEDICKKLPKNDASHNDRFRIVFPYFVVKILQGLNKANSKIMF